MKYAYDLVLYSALLLAISRGAPAAEIYVNAGNITGNELGTQQNPFRTVQAAIDASGDGDEIRVAAGTYIQNLRIQSKSLTMRGGYSGAWVRDLAKNQTTLSGTGGNSVINLIESNATIDGFRITGGTGSTEELPYTYRGGGIYSRDGSPTIANSLIEGNDIRSIDPPSDYNYGGGIHVTNAALTTIVNNVVRGNYAGRGAGITVLGEAALIEGNTIENNIAVGDHGGGLFIAVLNAQIRRNTFRRNEVGRELGYGWGGGLIVVGPGGMAELSYNRVYQNFAAAYGAGEFIDEGAQADIHHELVYRNVSKEGCEGVSAIAVDGGEGVGSQATIRHCTVVDNICENSFRGNGLQVEGQSVVSVADSIFWNNGGDDFAVFDASLSVSYSCSQEPAAGPGNFSTNPLFVNPAASNYHLASGSPCIDAGDPIGDYAGQTDFDGEPRVVYGRIDVGADEYVWRGPTDFDRDGDVDLDDAGLFQACFSGPDIARNPACQNADLDRDNDVDQDDFGQFQRCYGGEGKPSWQSCGQ